MRWLLLTLLVALIPACGDDETSDLDVAADAGADAEVDAGPPEPEYVANCDGALEDPLVRGKIWADPEDTATSWYQQPRASNAAGLPGLEVGLTMGDGTRYGALTCDDGTFRFPDASGEIGLLQLPSDTCTSANCPTGFARAAARGPVKVVTFGDSIPAFGPKPWFPERLKTLAAPVAEIENTNVAVPGSTSVEWLPGTRYFTNRIEAHLDADVWVFSIGGNDLQEFAGGFSMGGTQEEFADQLAKLNPLIDEIIANIRAIAAEIRTLDPDADIVWVVYPNYGTTEYWKQIAGPDFEAVIETGVGNILARVRRQLAGESGLHVVDILGATADSDLDSLLVDPLHLNEDGHEFYARELFVTLGGVIVTDPSLGLTRDVGYVE